MAKDGRNRNLKQPQHTTAQYFSCTIKSVQPPPVASTLKPLAKTLTTPPREDVLRVFPIGTTVVTESSSRTLSARCRTPRSVLRGTVQGQRLGATGATGGASDGPEHAPTTPRGIPRNRFTSVMSRVSYIAQQQTPLLCSESRSFAPTANTPPVFGTVFLLFQHSVRQYVAITTT